MNISIDKAVLQNHGLKSLLKVGALVLLLMLAFYTFLGIPRAQIVLGYYLFIDLLLLIAAHKEGGKKIIPWVASIGFFIGQVGEVYALGIDSFISPGLTVAVVLATVLLGIPVGSLFVLASFIVAFTSAKVGAFYPETSEDAMLNWFDPAMYSFVGFMVVGLPITQLKLAFKRLDQELELRKEAEEKVWESNRFLEQKISKRTQALEKVLNTVLEREPIRSLGEQPLPFAQSMASPLGQQKTFLNSLFSQLKYFKDELKHHQPTAAETHHAIDSFHQILKNVDKANQSLLVHTQGFVRRAEVKLKGDEEAFEIGELFLEVMPSFQERFTNLGYALNYKIEGIIWMEGIPGLLEQVLGILLDNAYNHAFEDGECGEVNVKVKPSAHDMISISVEDNGCGFLKNGEGTTMITPSSWNIESKGMGLYLAARFVAWLGGELRTFVPPSGGSCFVFTLPLRSQKQKDS